MYKRQGQGVPLVGVVYDQKISSFLNYIGQDLSLIHICMSSLHIRRFPFCSPNKRRAGAGPRPSYFRNHAAGVSAVQVVITPLLSSKWTVLTMWVLPIRTSWVPTSLMTLFLSLIHI